MEYGFLKDFCSSLPERWRSSCWWVRANLAPTFGAALVNLAAVVILVGNSLGFYWYFIQGPAVVSVEVVAISPEDRIIDRDQGDRLTISRRVVMRRSADVRIVRIWVDEGLGVQQTLDEWVYLEKGDSVRPVSHVSVPANLGEGKHRYRVYLECRNPLRTWQVHQEDIEFLIVGHPPFSRAEPSRKPRF